MKNIILFLLLYLLSGCYNLHDNKQETYKIPEYLFFNISDSVVFYEVSSFQKDTLKIKKDTLYDIHNRINGVVIKEQVIKATYYFKNYQMTITERYYKKEEDIKNKLEFNFYSESCNYVQNERIYIGDYQINDIIFKDVIKFSDCCDFKDIYVNYGWGIISFTATITTLHIKFILNKKLMK